MDKIKINKIEIKIGNKTIELSLKDAKDLKNILNETFPDASVTIPEIHHHYPNRYMYFNHQPYYTSGSWTADVNTEKLTATYSLAEN